MSSELDRELTRWLADVAPLSAPDHLRPALDEALRSEKPRPTWLALARERSMRQSGRVVIGSPVVRLALALMAIVLLAALTWGSLTVAARLLQLPRSLPPPFGATSNGAIAYDTSASIELANPDGTGVRPLVTDIEHAASATWSQDGTRIAFWGLNSPDALFVVDADGSHRVEVASDLWISTNWPPAWSPDGRSLVFSSETGPNRFDEDLYVASVSGAGVRRLFLRPEPTVRRLVPKWSPSGRWIAYVGLQGTDPSRAPALFAVRPDGTVDHPVRLPVVDREGAAWAPLQGHDRLAIRVGIGPDQHVEIVDVDTGAARSISRVDPVESPPSWAPDGDRLAWLIKGGRYLHVVRADTGEDVANVDAAGLASGLFWSPDGTKIMGLTADRSTVVVVPIDGSSTPTRIHQGGSQGMPTWQRAP